MAQTGKITYVVPDGTRCKIGEDYAKSTWYQIPDNVKEFVLKIPKGTVVEFGFTKDGDKNVLSFVKESNGSSASAPKKEFAPSKPSPAGGFSRGGTESVDRQNSIEKQAMMKTSAEVVSRLFSGQGDFSNMDPVWKAIEDGYDRLMKKFNAS